MLKVLSYLIYYALPIFTLILMIFAIILMIDVFKINKKRKNRGE